MIYQSWSDAAKPMFWEIFHFQDAIEKKNPIGVERRQKSKIRNQQNKKLVFSREPRKKLNFWKNEQNL